METFLQYFTEAKAPGLNITQHGKDQLKKSITNRPIWQSTLADRGYGLSNLFKRADKLKYYKVEDALANVIVDLIIKDLYKVIVKGEKESVLSLPYSRFMIPLSQVPEKLSKLLKGDESLVDMYTKEYVPDKKTTSWAYDKDGEPRDDIFTFIPNIESKEDMDYINKERDRVARESNGPSLAVSSFVEDWATKWLWLYNDVVDVHHFTDVFGDRHLAPIEAREAGVKEYMGDREDIADYFISNPSLERMREITDQYDKILKYRKRFEKEANLVEGGDIKTLTTYDNGYKMAQLLTTRGCKITGTAMGHCVGNYDPQRRPLLQLIGPENTLHATIELSLRNTLKTNVDGTPRKPEEQVRFYDVAQIKGKFNKSLTPSYERMVKEFFENWGVQDNIIELEQDNTLIPAVLDKMPSSFKYI